MEHQSPKAILVVSFGTSYEASRKATIEIIEQDIADAFPDHRIYHVQAEYAYLPAFSYTPRFPSNPRKYAHFFCKSDFCARHVLPSFVRLMHH